MLTVELFKKEHLPKEIIKKREHLLNYNEVISNFNAEISFSNDEHIGSYRLSKKLLRKIMTSTGKNAITKSELAVLIALLQICDNNYLVEDLHYSELIIKDNDGKGNISTKSYYNAIRGLKEKGFISYDDARGYRTIHILNNKIKKKEHYLSLNYNMFCPGTPENKTYAALPLGAQKLTLYLLFVGHPKFGYTANLIQIKEFMGYKSEYLLHRYIKLLTPIFGDIKLKKNVRGRKRNVNIHPSLNNALSMVPKRYMHENQLSYLRRKLECMLRTYNITTGNTFYAPSISLMTSEVYQFIKNNIKRGPKNLFKIIEYSAVTQGEFNLQSLRDALYILANA